MEEFQNDNSEEQITRPRSLSFLCIATFIFSGLGTLSSIIAPIYADQLKIYMMSDPNYDEAMMADNLKVIEAGWGYYSLTLLLAIGSLTGALFMWKLKKIGFHFYAFSNLIMLFLPTLFLDITISWYAIFFTLSFIGLYAFHLKFMK